VRRAAKLILFIFSLVFIGSCAHMQTNFQQKILPRESFVKIEKSLSIHACEDNTSCADTLLRSVASGVVVYTGVRGAYVLTAAHVCDDSDVKDKYKKLPKVKFTGDFMVRDLDNDRKPVEILEFNTKHDICMLWVKNLFLPPIVISPSAPKPGDRVFNISAPLGIFSKNMVPIFEGFYNGTDEAGNALYSMPSIGGSSGSPITNRKGELIGMVHSTIRFFNQIAISPNYKALREFINESIDNHSSRSYFHTVWRSFI